MQNPLLGDIIIDPSSHLPTIFVARITNEPKSRMKLPTNKLLTIILLLIFVLACNQSYIAQVERDSDLIKWMYEKIYPLHNNNPDSVHVLLNTIWSKHGDQMTDNEKILFFLLRGRAYRNRLINNPVAAETNFLKSLYHFERLTDGSLAQKAIITRDIGAIHLQAGNFNRALDLYRQARTLLGDYHRPRLLHSIYIDKGTLLAGMGNPEASLYYTQRAIEIARKENIKTGEATGLINLSMAFATVGEFAQAEENIRRAIPIFTELNLPRRLQTAYRNLSLTLVNQNRFEEAFHYAQKSDKIAATLGLPQTAMAPYYAGRGKRYFDVNNYRSSLEMLYRALELNTKIQQVGLIGEIKNNIGSLHNRMGNVDKALSYVNEALRIAQENGLSRLEIGVQNNLVAIHATHGDIEKIMAAVEAERILYNQIFTEQNSRAMHEMQVRYETKLNELLIARQTEEIQQKRIIIALLLSTSLVVTLLLVLIVFFQRRKMQNTTRIVQQYEQLLGYKKKEEATKTSSVDAITKRVSKDLEHLFEVEKIYRQQKLSITEVAERLGINRNYLSAVFNQGYQKQFSDFVNAYRIAEAREILKKQSEGTEYPHYTNQAISEIVGFNNTASFYTAFKQEIGVTPTEYKNAIRHMKA